MLDLKQPDTDITPEEWNKIQQIQFEEWSHRWPVTPVGELVERIRNKEDNVS